MLEIGQYLILDWQAGCHGAKDDLHYRDILHPATRTRLGRVRTQAKPSAGWLRWLRSYHLEIYESEDESLLMVLRRPWRILRLWDILDADLQRIGSVYPPWILDEEGIRRAAVDRHFSGRGRIVATDGRTLAEIGGEVAGELHLQFAADLEENPFQRMLLLASAIALDTLPTGA